MKKIVLAGLIALGSGFTATQAFADGGCIIDGNVISTTDNCTLNFTVDPKICGNGDGPYHFNVTLLTFDTQNNLVPVSPVTTSAISYNGAQGEQSSLTLTLPTKLDSYMSFLVQEQTIDPNISSGNQSQSGTVNVIDNTSHPYKYYILPLKSLPLSGTVFSATGMGEASAHPNDNKTFCYNGVPTLNPRGLWQCPVGDQAK